MLPRTYTITAILTAVTLVGLCLSWWLAFTNRPNWFECRAVPYTTPKIPAFYLQRCDRPISISRWAGEPIQHFETGEHVYLDAHKEGWISAIGVASLHDDWTDLREFVEDSDTDSVDPWLKHYLRAFRVGYLDAVAALNAARKDFAVAEIQRQIDEQTGRFDKFFLPAILTAIVLTAIIALRVQRPRSAG